MKMFEAESGVFFKNFYREYLLYIQNAYSMSLSIRLFVLKIKLCHDFFQINTFSDRSGLNTNEIRLRVEIIVWH